MIHKVQLFEDIHDLVGNATQDQIPVGLPEFPSATEQSAYAGRGNEHNVGEVNNCPSDTLLENNNDAEIYTVSDSLTGVKWPAE